MQNPWFQSLFPNLQYVNLDVTLATIKMKILTSRKRRYFHGFLSIARVFLLMLIITTRRLSWNGCCPLVWYAAGRKYPAVGPVQSVAVYFSVALCASRPGLRRFAATSASRRSLSRHSSPGSALDEPDGPRQPPPSVEGRRSAASHSNCRHAYHFESPWIYVRNMPFQANIQHRRYYWIYYPYKFQVIQCIKIGKSSIINILHVIGESCSIPNLATFHY